MCKYTRELKRLNADVIKYKINMQCIYHTFICAYACVLGYVLGNDAELII